MSETLFYGINFHLIGAIYYFKRGQSLKYQRFNKYNRKSSGATAPNTLPRYVAARTPDPGVQNYYAVW